MRHWKEYLFVVAIALSANLPLFADSPGEDENPDGKIGTFRQHRTGDCFFLVSILALANDSSGRPILEDSIAEVPGDDAWTVQFASHPDSPVRVDRKDLNEHLLFTARGTQRTAKPASGDPDIRLLEIAADRLWVRTDVKPQGLWDDVPMNAIAMFAASPQQLIWNPDKASSVSKKDIAKADRLPADVLQQRKVKSPEEAESILKSIVESDTGGLSMTLLDYQRYHGLAITAIDFDDRTYSYLDPLRGTDRILKGSLDTLVERTASGKYAINYIEVSSGAAAK